MFSRLLAHPGVVETVTLRSTFGFMAFHGGSLERFTDTIADAAAEAAGASSYLCVQPPEFRWHIPSTKVNPAESERLAAFMDHVDVAVAIHGFGRGTMFTTMLLGGRNRDLATHFGGHLRARLGHYRVVDELDDIPTDLRGLHPDNPVNVARGGGVQIELPPRIRGMGPFWHGEPYDGAANPHTAALIDALSEAARTWDGSRMSERGSAPSRQSALG